METEHPRREEVFVEAYESSFSGPERPKMQENTSETLKSKLNIQPRPVPPNYSPTRLIRNLISPDTAQVKAHELVTNSPFPTHSPYGIRRAASTVINVPKDEIQEFLDVVVNRYIKTIKKEAIQFFKRDTKLVSTTDEELEKILTDSLFSRFLIPHLDADDLEIFFDYIEEDESYFKVDMAHLDKMEPIEGLHYCSTKTLLVNKGDTVKLKAIQIKDIIVTPGDPDWERAKMFVIQGFCLALLIYEHPKRHFPMDAINGLTKYMLPKGHIISRLFEPHLYMQLPLNFAVLYINKSVGHGDQNEVYTLLPCTKNGFVASLRASYEGIRGNSAFPKFRYNLRPERIPFGFGKFLERYWWAVYQFVEEFTQGIEKYDEAVSLWADDCAHFVPGFPNSEKIWEEDNLVSALTTFIYTVSFAHATDHHNYSLTNINQIPARLRVKPPSSKRRGAKWPESTTFTRNDLFRHHMAMEMYFKPTNIVTILNTKYDTKTMTENNAVNNFKNNLVQIESTLETTNYAPLSEIACSIQY